MFRNDFIRAEFRRFFKRERLALPGRLNHSRFAVFFVTDRAVHHKPHAVDKPCFCGGFAESYFYGFAGNEFRFGCGYCFARAGLRKFVGGDLLFVLARNIRRYQKFGEAFHERGFARSHRSHHANVNISARSLAYIAVNIVFLHKNSLRHFAYDIILLSKAARYAFAA